MAAVLTVINLIYWFFWLMILIRIIFSFVALIYYSRRGALSRR